MTGFEEERELMQARVHSRLLGDRGRNCDFVPRSCRSLIEIPYCAVGAQVSARPLVALDPVAAELIDAHNRIDDVVSGAKLIDRHALRLK